MYPKYLGRCICDKKILKDLKILTSFWWKVVFMTFPMPKPTSTDEVGSIWSFFPMVVILKDMRYVCVRKYEKAL